MTPDQYKEAMKPYTDALTQFSIAWKGLEQAGLTVRCNFYSDNVKPPAVVINICRPLDITATNSQPYQNMLNLVFHEVHIPPVYTIVTDAPEKFIPANALWEHNEPTEIEREVERMFEKNSVPLYVKAANESVEREVEKQFELFKAKENNI